MKQVPKPTSSKLLESILPFRLKKKSEVPSLLTCDLDILSLDFKQKVNSAINTSSFSGTFKIHGCDTVSDNESWI